MPIVAKFSMADKPRPRRRRLRSLSFLPTLLSLGNLLCGFAAIHFGLRAMYEFGSGGAGVMGLSLHGGALERMLPSFLSVGAGLVILGMVFDGFDGLVARATRSTTNFGGQLDSLADVVTCGVAPATLMVAFMTQQLAGDSIFPSPISEHLLGRAAWLAAAVYVAFAAIRLARFNVEHARADSDHHTFRGLPSPGAAVILVAMILLQDQMGGTARLVIAYAMPVAALTTASLMVSRIPYRRFYRAYLLGQRPFGQFVVLLLVLAAFWLYKAPTLMLLVLWYGSSGPLFYLVRRGRDRKQQGTASLVVASEQQHREVG